MRGPAPVLVVAVLLAATAEVPHAGDPTAQPYLTGQFLVAADGMADPRFSETVIYVIDHSADGAMGVVINRPIGEGRLAILLRAFGVDDDMASAVDAEIVTLRYGGPVEPNRGVVLHSADYSGESTEPVTGGVAVSFGKDVLEAVAEGRGPESAIYLMGYAGWSAGQLERELDRDDWLVAPADETAVFQGDPDGMWRRAKDAAGIRL